jgi:hypothetical protein
MRKFYIFLILGVIKFSPGFAQVSAPVYPLPKDHPVYPAAADPQTAQNPDSWWLADSVWYSSWNTGSAAWHLYEREFKSYTNNGFPSEDLYLLLNGTTALWDNYNRYQYVYGPQGNTQQYNGQVWNILSGNWIQNMHSHYDDFGRMDTNWNKVFDMTTHHFISGVNGIYSFNSTNQMTGILLQMYDTITQGWKNYVRMTYTFSATGQMTETLGQIWSDLFLDWINNQKYEYFYDASGFSTGYLSSFWNTTTNTWDPYSNATYTNNTGGMPVTELFQFWDAGSSSWINFEKMDFTYTAANLVAGVLDQHWNGTSSSWINYSKEEHTFYSNNYQKNSYQWYWNPNGQFWMDTWYYYYDSLGGIQENYVKYLDFSTYAYTAGYRYLYYYNSAHQSTEYDQYMLEVGFNTWDPSARRQYTYDANGNNTVILDQNYNAATSQYDNTAKIETFFGLFTGNAEKTGITPACIYANPLVKGGRITCPELHPGQVYSMGLYSLDGKLVHQAVAGPGEGITIPVTIPSGMYVMRIFRNGILYSTGKVVVTG